MKHIAISENHLYSKSYAKGNKYVGENVVIYVLKDLKAKKLMMANPMKVYINRIGITVSKKLGGAVCRTRIKRILREGLRQTEKENKVKGGYLVVLAARSGAREAKSTDIANDVKRAFMSLGLIEKKEKADTESAICAKTEKESDFKAAENSACENEENT